MSDYAEPVKAYKDRMFIHLFSERNRLLQLYNAVCGTDYDNSEELQVNTLENVLYMNMKNDVSFLMCQEELSLYEHQSTYNPNMPLRGLLYIARLYEKLTKGTGLYATKQIRLPNPQYVIFYNGLAKMPRESVLKLSDAYIKKAGEPELELRVRMININYNENPEFLQKCPALLDYSYFVELVRSYQQSFPLQEAIRRAIIKSKEENVLKDYLEEHGSEVENMLMTEYSRELDIEVNRSEAKEEGKIEGKIEAILLLLEEYSLAVPLADRIRREEDPLVLDGWLKAAKKASSLREFVELTGLDDH